MKFWQKLRNAVPRFMNAGTEGELAELKLRYDTLLQAMPQFVAIKDREKRFVKVSPGFCAFVGRTEAQILNKTDFDLFVPEHAKSFQKDDDLVLTGEIDELAKEE